MFYNQNRTLKVLFCGVYKMSSIDKRLFDYYCSPILQDAENFNNSDLEKILDSYPLTKEHHYQLIEIFFDHYMQWSLDAFAVGLHLGLSLNGDVRRGRPQQVQ